MDVQERQSDYVFHKCFHPTLLTNRYNGKDYAVNCRWCLGCLTRRGDMLANRLKNEFTYGKYRYPLFLTFTYANSHLPVFFRTVNDDGSLSPFYISWDGQVVPAAKVNDMAWPKQDEEDIMLHINSHDKVVYSAFASFNVKHLQDTFKRIRIKLARTKGIKSDAFRYFFVSEYGARTFRPHYHGLVWCESKEVQDFFLAEFDTSGCKDDNERNELGLRSLWSHGRTDCQIPKQNESVDNYVSKYITGFDVCSNFTVKGFRPFYICSKAPLVGINPCEVASLEGRFADAVEHSARFSAVYDKKSTDGQTVTPVMYSTGAIYSVVPKCTGFGNLSRSERIGVYSFLHGRPDAKIEHYSRFVFSEISHGIIEENVVCIDGVEVSSQDYHCMKVYNRLYEKYKISPAWYVDLLDEFYTDYFSNLLGVQCLEYSDYFDRFGNNWYIFAADLPFAHSFFDSRYVGSLSRSDKRMMLRALFGDKCPDNMSIKDFVLHNKNVSAYEERIKDRCSRRRKVRYDNEYCGRI